MKNSGLKYLVFLGMIAIFAVVAPAQKAKPVAPYTITDIKVLPFDEVTGKFRDPIDLEHWFGNDLSVSLLATIELTGTPGEFVAERKLNIRVTEGKKVKLTRVGYPGVFSETGKFYVPVWLYGSMCEPVKITATMVGQTKKSTKSRTVNFHCGE